MRFKDKIYAGRKYLFRCRKCKKKREFDFMHYQMKRMAVIKCCSCEFLTSRHTRLLDKQISEGEK